MPSIKFPKKQAGKKKAKTDTQPNKVKATKKSIRSKNPKKAKRAKRAKKERIYAPTTGYFDLGLFAVVIILISFGLVMLYSASAYEAANTAGINDDMFYFRRQALISLGAIGIALLVSIFDYHLWISFSPVIYIAAIILMGMVKFTPFGLTAGGATRWLSIGPISFQPAEIAKIAIILIMPYLILRMGKKVATFKGHLLLLAVGAVQMLAAYFFTENLSTGLIIMGISLMVIYFAQPKGIYFWGTLGAAAAAVAGFLIYANTLSSSGSFRIRRVLVWLNPEENMEAGGYQVLQGLYAIGNGGFFGRGLGNSTQKLSVIPEAQNDMIFSIVCEELGVFGAALLMILFCYLLFRLLFIAQNAPDLYGTLVATGIFVHIALQVILNICVVLNVIPTTGVTLPFVSYGGTSVLFLMVEMGLALSISRRIEFEDPEEEELPKVPIDKNEANA